MSSTTILRARVLAALGTVPLAAPLAASGCIIVVETDKDQTDAVTDDTDSTPETDTGSPDDTDLDETDTDLDTSDTGDSSGGSGGDTSDSGDSGDTDTGGIVTGFACNAVADLATEFAQLGYYQDGRRYQVCYPFAYGSADCNDIAAQTMGTIPNAWNPALEATVHDILDICSAVDTSADSDTDCTWLGPSTYRMCGPDPAFGDCCFAVELVTPVIGRPFATTQGSGRASASVGTGWVRTRRRARRAHDLRRAILTALS